MMSTSTSNFELPRTPSPYSYYYTNPVFDSISAFSSTLTHEECLSDLPLNHYIKYLQTKDANITNELFYEFIQYVYAGLQPNTYTAHNLLPHPGFHGGNRGQEFFALTQELQQKFKPILDYYKSIPNVIFDPALDQLGTIANSAETFNKYWAENPNNFGYTLNTPNDPSRYYDRVRSSLHGSLIEHKDENLSPDNTPNNNSYPLNNTNPLTPNIPTSADLPYTRYTSIAPYWPHSHRNHNILKNDPYLIKGDMQDPAATYPTSTNRN